MTKKPNNPNNLIMFSGGKENEEVEEEVTLATIITGDKIRELESFIISGRTPEGHDSVFVFNATLRDIVHYTYLMDTTVRDEVRNAYSPQHPPENR
ncbi:hypothetical protein CN918_26880 [Priestia megaterium]|nr:hypothetical protein CN918_26880 [Priestia megaterium]